MARKKKLQSVMVMLERKQESQDTAEVTITQYCPGVQRMLVKEGRSHLQNPMVTQVNGPEGTALFNPCS